MKQLFPPELILQSPEEKIKYFENYQVKHDKLEESYKDVTDSINDARPGQVITLLGPAGVGKTTILRRLLKDFSKSFDNEANSGSIPIVMTEAVKAPKAFDWKDYYIRLLAELYDPIPTRKVDYRKWDVLPTELSDIVRRENNSAAVYRRALENALRYRRPAAVLVDEAQHMGKVASGDKTIDQLNIIKSIANMTKVPHVLCGTYELLPFLNLSGQLCRRSGEIHFRRYKLDNKKDVEAFENIVTNFQLHMPLPKMPPLYSHWKYLYERSLGCTGILYDWLMRALKKALRENAETLTKEILQETSLSLVKCETILEEILYGEDSLIETDKNREIYLNKLGFNLNTVEDAEPMLNKSAESKRAPGERKPKRDPAGWLSAA